LFVSNTNPIIRFDPNAQQDKAAERRECERVKQLALNLIPEAIQVGLHINVAQVFFLNHMTLFYFVLLFVCLFLLSFCDAFNLKIKMHFHVYFKQQVVCGDPTCAPIGNK
jgi:hypothetical protein